MYRLISAIKKRFWLQSFVARKGRAVWAPSLLRRLLNRPLARTLVVLSCVVFLLWPTQLKQITPKAQDTIAQNTDTQNSAQGSFTEATLRQGQVVMAIQTTALPNEITGALVDLYSVDSASFQAEVVASSVKVIEVEQLNGLGAVVTVAVKSSETERLAIASIKPLVVVVKAP